MKPAFTVQARKADGRLTVIDHVRYARGIEQLADGDYDVSIAPKAVRRSKKANAYYWGVVLKLISEHTGYHPDELHELFKKQFLPEQTKRLLIQDEHGVVQLEGDVPVETTTALDGKAFSDYIECIRIVAASIDVVIPDPDKEFMFNKESAA